MATNQKMQLPIGVANDDELGIVLSTLLPRGAQFTGNEVEYRTIAADQCGGLRRSGLVLAQVGDRADGSMVKRFGWSKRCRRRADLDGLGGGVREVDSRWRR
jgi:hypothetical protein